MNPRGNKAGGEAEAAARRASAECGNPAAFPGKSGWPKYRSPQVVPCYFCPLICCHEFCPFLQTVTAGSFYSSFSFLPPPSLEFTDLYGKPQSKDAPIYCWGSQDPFLATRQDPGVTSPSDARFWETGSCSSTCGNGVRPR